MSSLCYVLHICLVNICLDKALKIGLEQELGCISFFGFTKKDPVGKVCFPVLAPHVEA